MNNDRVSHWGVDVRVNHEHILTIESNCLFGKGKLSYVEIEAISTCAAHLVGFAGKVDDKRPFRLVVETLQEIDKIVGGKELAHMPKEVAKLFVSLKRWIQDLPRSEPEQH